MTREDAIKAIDHLMYSSPHETTEEVVKKKYYAEKLIDYIAHTIEVVRCKECKFYDPLDPNRPYDCLYMESVFGDDYCSRGKKR